jgi:hypothetical protein
MKLELRKREDMVPQILEDAHDHFSCSVVGNVLIRRILVYMKILIQGYEAEDVGMFGNVITT